MMNVSEIMTSNPVVVYQGETLDVALKKMWQVGCHHLPVLNRERQVMGILTDQDCRVALYAPLLPPVEGEHVELARQIQVQSAMSPAPIIVEPNVRIEEAVSLMYRHHVSSLPVMLDETLVGIVTTSDIMVAFLKVLGRDKESVRMEDSIGVTVAGL
jgi:acetoin utilization protein AcuB